MGVPIVLKDIIDATPMYTTAGDWALRESFPEKDSGVARNLRAHGVVILGKLGLSEWANSFGSQPSGFSQRDRPGAERERRGRGPERLLLGLGRGRGRGARAADDRHRNGRIDHQPVDRRGDRWAETDARPRARVSASPRSTSRATPRARWRRPSRTRRSPCSRSPRSPGPIRNQTKSTKAWRVPNFLKNGDILPAPFTTLPNYSSALTMSFVKGKRIGFNGNTCTIVPPATTCTPTPTQEAIQKAVTALEAAGAIMVPDAQTTAEKTPRSAERLRGARDDRRVLQAPRLRKCRSTASWKRSQSTTPTRRRARRTATRRTPKSPKPKTCSAAKTRKNSKKSCRSRRRPRRQRSKR